MSYVYQVWKRDGTAFTGASAQLVGTFWSKKSAEEAKAREEAKDSWMYVFIESFEVKGD